MVLPSLVRLLLAGYPQLIAVLSPRGAGPVRPAAPGLGR